MIAFTVVSTKGGVGKTTLAANLGALLADFGMRVLLIDADVQTVCCRGTTTSRNRAPYGLTEVIAEGLHHPRVHLDAYTSTPTVRRQGASRTSF